MGRHYRQRPHHSRRARCERGWLVGARSRPHVRNRIASVGDGTPLPDDRANGRSNCVQQRNRSRTSAHDRLRWRNLRSPRGPEHLAWNLRTKQSPVGTKRNTMGFRISVAATRFGAHCSRARARLCTLPRRGPSRNQEVCQWTIHILSGRQPARGPNQGHARNVVGLCSDGRIVARWRRWAFTCQLDGARRPGRRHLGHGRCPLRRLRNAGIHQREGARKLFASIPHHLPERRACSSTTTAHHTYLRPLALAQCCYGRRLWS